MSDEAKPLSETAVELAEEIGKTAQENPEELKIENQAPDQQIEFVARFFHMYLPVFKQKLSKLNKKGLQRVIERLVEWPLNEKELKWPFKEEKDAFLIGDRLLESKYAMFRYVINDEMQKAEPKKEEPKLDMTKVTDALVPGTDKSMDELRREGSYEEGDNNG